MTGNRQMNGPKVSIILINFNGLPDTIECLRSLQAIPYPNHEIILVDNGSTNNEADQLEERFPEVNVIRNATNMGFCNGNNVGARIALQNNTDYLLFLNNDTYVQPDFLEKLIQFCETNPDVGICGPLIYYYDEKDHVYSSGGRLNQLIFKCREYKHVHDGPNTGLNFLSGCAFMVRREVVEKIGLWDEQYFTYWEEADYCLRARKAGYKIACLPDSIIYHKVARTSVYLSVGYVYYMVRNNLIIAAKHAKWFTWPFVLLNFFARRWLGYGLKLTLTRNFSSLPAIFWGTADFVFHQYGKGRY